MYISSVQYSVTQQRGGGASIHHSIEVLHTPRFSGLDYIATSTLRSNDCEHSMIPGRGKLRQRYG